MKVVVNMKLGEIADVSIGILVNREQKEIGKNIYGLFNLKQYEENQPYDTIQTDKNFLDKLTKKGDLLFRLVTPNKVIYVTEEEENLLIPSQLCLIRTNKEVINPIFLKWYLESNVGKEEIMLEIVGSSIQKISVSALKNIEIPLLDKEKQKNISNLIKLWNDEKEVLTSMIETREMLYDSIIEEIIEKN